MNKKIDFIICSNKKVFLKECLYYISLLNVPNGYEINVLVNEGAYSMTSGYNEAMKASDASIKIYMHQDVFIVNPDFLNDIVKIFDSDSQVGMIGMVGYENVNDEGVMWREKRTGNISQYGYSNCEKNPISYHFDLEKDLSDVAVLDGLMIITSKDIEWDERFDAWDFYDASQCMRFLKAGYRIVVPTPENPWVIHDDGKYLAVFDYEKYRELFVSEYGDCINGS